MPEMKLACGGNAAPRAPFPPLRPLSPLRPLIRLSPLFSYAHTHTLYIRRPFKGDEICTIQKKKK